jgi:glutamate formiminotransferase / 5-formyltetrahydrofolate cyclo-ligase
VEPTSCDSRHVATTLLAYPNISGGREAGAIDQISEAFGDHLLDVHFDLDHNRSAFTLAGEPDDLARSVAAGAQRAIALFDIAQHAGVHPHVGIIDVAPIVYLSDRDRGPACAEALVLADMLGSELDLPVFLYGLLGGGATRAQLRRGGPAGLRRRMQSGELTPDFGPNRMHPTAGAALVAARPPLVAFNVELEPPATVEDARAIAAHIREGGDEGLSGVRAIGLWLDHRGLAQVSTNVEDHRATSLAEVIEAVARHARPAGAELVGLAPRAALEGFPADVPLRGYATIEDALAQPGRTA